MLQNIRNSFLLAWGNIWSNLFHTVLSVLGVIIGVGALVSILSLIDGMEQFARSQVALTTQLNAILLRSQPYKYVNDVRLKKDSTHNLDYPHFLDLYKSLTKSTTGFIRVNKTDEVTVGKDHVIGVNATAVGVSVAPEVVLASGSLFTSKELNNSAQVAIVNKAFLIAAKINTPDAAINQTLVYNRMTLKIKGVLADEKNKKPQLLFPITLLTPAELMADPPEAIFVANKTEEIPMLKEEISSWLGRNYTRSIDDFEIITNESRVEQVARGFLLFRVIMGLIVGISVIVGGIGVMNVLLISVTERTVEIGIRKAVGANRRDIVLLFLAESITVSAFGSFVGVVFGVIATMVIIPIVKAITKVPFQAAYTLNTFLIISLVALIVGVVFGTYPALRASRLNPVDAIRHE